MPGATPDSTSKNNPPATLRSKVIELHGVSTKRAKLFARLGVHTLGDLIRHLPLRYTFEHSEGAIGDLPMNAVGSARGTVVRTRWVAQGRRPRFQATVQDHSDTLSVTWFNARYLRDKLHPGMTVRLQGKTTAYQGYPQMVNPTFEVLTDSAETEAKEERFRPVYPATEDLPSGVIERVIADALPTILPLIRDPLPDDLVSRLNMPTLCDAFRWVHQPEHEEQAAAARRRLSYNELFLLQLGIALKRLYNERHLKAPALRHSEAIDEHICARFPFDLTDAQRRVVNEIASDLQRTQPMNRLVQGDVGSGKTVVALYALLMAVSNRKQGALMAPTELLAEQHFTSITSMLEGSNVRIELLTGALTGAARESLLSRVEVGEVDIVVGTQALLTETVQFNELAVVVVDEQHRFGVMQRAAFRQRGSKETEPENAGNVDDSAGDTPKAERGGKQLSPHYLVMTATPIPRTLSLTIFGDLDVSTIDRLPPGRTPITTRVVGQDKSDEVYKYLAKRVELGEQAYVVVPIIDADDSTSARTLKSVREHAKMLEENYLPERKVSAIHGRLKRPTRERIMYNFREGRVDVLVATTVIEVGVDVPNATVMVVEHAERFGLASLHQLRGRIGRGTHASKPLCVFIAEPNTEDATQRMAAIGSTTDGFKIAEHDLQIRGMGDFFGTRQHGLPPLRVARIPDDMELLQQARRDADQLAHADPTLTNESHTLLKTVLMQHYGETLTLIDVG